MKHILIIIAALFILAACAQPQESKAKEIAEQIKQQTTEEQVVEEVEQAAQQVEEIKETIEQAEQAAPITETEKQLETTIVEETTSKPQQRTRMYRFLDTFASQVKSYEFKYKGDEYYVKGQKYKIILDNPVTAKDVTFGDLKKSLFYYDAVYVDRGTKTAVAYCEGHSSQVNTQCTQLNIYDLMYPVSFTDYDTTLPEDWLFTYLDKEPDQLEDNKYYIEGRSTVYVKFNEEPELELNFDPSTGLVLRADKKKGNQLLERQDYEQLASNKVRDIDVIHRSKSEIPSEETFYR